MLLLSLASAHAENVPCTASTSGPGWRASLSATVTGGALTQGHQEVTVDIAAIDQGDSPYEYNGAVNRPPAPMARVRIVEEVAAQPRQWIELLAPEVFAPVDVMLASLSGGTSPPLRAALRLSAGGQVVAWIGTTTRPSPADLPGNNVNVYAVSLGEDGSAAGSRVLDAFAGAGELRVETIVARADGQDGRFPFPDHDDPAKTDVAGTFVFSAAALAPGLAAIQTLQTELGGQLATGKCGDTAVGGGKK